MKLTDQVFQNFPKTRVKLDAFWDLCKKSTSNGPKLEQLCQEFESKTQKMQAEVQQHKEFLEHVPLIVVLRNWLEKQASSENQELLDCFTNLIEKEMIPSHDSTGRIWDLQLQQQHGHQNSIENIRCYREWTMAQREKIVLFYLMFAKYLAIATFGFVPYEEDPDKVKTARRVLPFEVYMDFVSQLPERDSLIAAVLYYGGITVTELLNLKASQVDFKSNCIHFEKETIFYPRHVMDRLQAFMQNKKPTSLAFTSRTGEQVNRSRLFTSFKNASAKMSSPREIAPAILVESRIS